MKESNIRIVFFGTPNFAVPSLEALIDAKYNVVTVVTSPDKLLGRKRILTRPPIKVSAESHGIKVLQPEKLSEDNTFDVFTKLNPDLCVVTAYGKIIPDSWLSIPRYGYLNVHPSVLPKYRGPSPIRTSIMNGDTDTGITIMKIDKELDHGPLVATRAYSIPEDAYLQDIERDLFNMGAVLLLDSIPGYISENIKPQQQEHHLATFTHKVNRDTGRIVWSKSAQAIYAQIRALNPEPGSWTLYNKKTLNITRAHIEVSRAEKKVGTVIKHGNGCAVTTGDGLLVLEEIQPEGGRKMSMKDYLNGKPNFIGAYFE